MVCWDVLGGGVLFGGLFVCCFTVGWGKGLCCCCWRERQRVHGRPEFWLPVRLHFCLFLHFEFDLKNQYFKIVSIYFVSVRCVKKKKRQTPPKTKQHPLLLPPAPAALWGRMVFSEILAILRSVSVMVAHGPKGVVVGCSFYFIMLCGLEVGGTKAGASGGRLWLLADSGAVRIHSACAECRGASLRKESTQGKFCILQH